MELSSGSPNSLKFTRGQRNSFYSVEAEAIDVSKINFEDDETWLYSGNTNQGYTTNVQDWLYNGLESNSVLNLTSSTVDLQKNIDTRTFTRPKKRFSRPSIEQYNDLYGSSSETITIHSDSKSYVIEEKAETDISKPNFDLTQPSSSYYFEKMVADSEEATDSFINMSPPSLVNSMCSSMFANLMESSFIKNDPVLREIRDADYSDSVLLQDSETPMMQSIESCSSFNSDTPESFLKKVLFNGTFKRNLSGDGDKCLNSTITIDKSIEQGVSEDGDSTLKNITENDQTYINPNGTYRRTPKHSLTFKKSDIKKTQKLLQSTFEVLPQEQLHCNRTHTLIDCGSFEDIKRDLSEPVEVHTDLNRLSYCLENEVKLDMTYNEINRTTNLKSSVLSGSAGSADSLDRLSSMSGSSRGSNKMLNMSDVDAIVDMQERSLQQAMSTPKNPSAPKILWDNNFTSPIVPLEATSDSDLSSIDDYKSVKSTESSKTSLDGYMPKQQPKRISYITGPADTKIKTNQKSSYTVVAPKPMAPVRTQVQNTKVNSYSNLRHSNMPGSNPNLYRPSSCKSPPAPTSNLKAMGPKLKGSYTSLRPISSILPVAPPLVSDVNQTMTISKTEHHNVMHTLESGTGIVEVKTIHNEKATVDDTFIKPPQPKPSGLPRPSSIPRPATSSRIPAPRSSNVRRIPPRPTYSGKQLTKTLTQ